MILILLFQLRLQVKDAVLKIELVHVMLSFERQDLVLGLLTQSVAGLGEAVALLNLINETTDLLVVARVYLTLDCRLLTSGINRLLERLVARLELVVLDERLVELVLLELYLMGVTLHHDLFNLILLNALSDSILESGGGASPVINERPCRQISTFKGNTKLLAIGRILNIAHGCGFFVDKLFLSLLDLAE